MDTSTITKEYAINLLPEKKKIKTMRNLKETGIIMLTDWEKEEVISVLSEAKKIMKVGAIAQSMGYGIAIWEDESWLFIETRKGVE